MKRKLICTVLVIAMLVISLAACAPNESDEADAGNAPQDNVATEGQDAQEDSETATSDEKTTIKYVSWMTNGEDIPFVEAFMEENPDIIVEYEAIDGNNYDKLLKVRLMTDDAPDVFMIQWGQYAKYNQEGYLMDLTGQPAMELLKTSQPLTDAFTIDEKQFGFPLSTNGGPIPIYYNKVYFDKLGITPPTTLDEFYDVCEKIKADGVDPIVFGGQDKWPIELFFRFRQYSGMLSEHPQWGKELYEGEMLASEFFKNEYEMTQNLLDKGYISKASLTLTWPQSVPYFIEGKAAMLPQGPWVPSLPEIAEVDPEQFQLACFTSPAEPAADGIIYSMGEIDRSLVVSSQTKNKEAALRFFNWFAGEENLSNYLGTYSLTNFIDLDYEINPVLEQYVKDVSSDKYHIIMSQDVQMAQGFITESCWNGFQNILAGSPASTELEKLDSEFEKTKDACIVLK